jgi:exopolyphosphatase/guanosine-5'-triphosphate,3'-diphosphate pyrophosphatase
VRTLAGLLRVAVGLDRNHNGAVASVRCWEDDEDRLVIGARPQGEADIELDLFSAGQRTGLLGDVLGVEVLVEADTGADVADDALVPAGAP